jgi:hypothetical protein
VLLQGFRRIRRCVRGSFQPASAIFQPASAVPCARIWHSAALGASPRGVAVRRAPEAGPVRGNRGEHSDLFCTFPRRLSAGWRVTFPKLPSSGSRIVDSSLSYYRVIQVDAHAPFDKGWLVVRRLVHKKRSRGCAR